MISGVGTDANPKLMVFSSFQSLERPENSPLLLVVSSLDFVVAVTALVKGHKFAPWPWRPEFSCRCRELFRPNVNRT